MKETISGLHVKDYHDLDLNALEEIICLEEQLQRTITELEIMLNDGEIYKAKQNLKWLHEDSCSLARWATQCQADRLESMENESRVPDVEKLRLSSMDSCIYYDTDSVVDGSDKTFCAYDRLTPEEIAAISLMRVIGNRIKEE